MFKSARMKIGMDKKAGRGLALCALIIIFSGGAASSVLAAKRIEYDSRNIPAVGDGPPPKLTREQQLAVETDRALAASDRAMATCAEEALPTKGQSPVDIALQTEHYQYDDQRRNVYDACLLRHGFLPDQADREKTRRVQENPNLLGAGNLPRPEYMDALLAGLMDQKKDQRTDWMTPPSVLLGDAAKAAEQARNARGGSSYLARYGTIPADFKAILSGSVTGRPKAPPATAPVGAPTKISDSVNAPPAQTGGHIVGPERGTSRPSLYIAPTPEKTKQDGPRRLFLSP